jgi:hypothetical protein
MPISGRWWPVPAWGSKLTCSRCDSFLLQLLQRMGSGDCRQWWSSFCPWHLLLLSSSVFLQGMNTCGWVWSSGQSHASLNQQRGVAGSPHYGNNYSLLIGTVWPGTSQKVVEECPQSGHPKDLVILDDWALDQSNNLLHMVEPNVCGMCSVWS